MFIKELSAVSYDVPSFSETPYRQSVAYLVTGVVLDIRGIIIVGMTISFYKIEKVITIVVELFSC